MSLTMFSVDVETSGLNPFMSDAHLLTVGAVAMDEQGTQLDDWYSRIDRSDVLEPAWFDDTIPTDPGDTLAFWREQDVWVRGEAWEDKTLFRPSAHSAAYSFAEWVLSFSPVWEERVFVANPATFDFMWLCSLWAETGVADPFHYHSLCLHSMQYGAQPKSTRSWHAKAVRDHRAEQPHHALSDAYAQALDFKDMP